MIEKNNSFHSGGESLGKVVASAIVGFFAAFCILIFIWIVVSIFQWDIMYLIRRTIEDYRVRTLWLCMWLVCSVWLYFRK